MQVSAIPKRGRIRVVLAVAVIVAAIMGFSRRGNSTSSQPVNKPSAVVPPKPASAAPTAPQVAAPPPKPKTSWFTPFSAVAPTLRSVGNSLTEPELALMLREHPPTAGASVDTLNLGRQSVVVHYSIDADAQDFTARLIKQYQPRYAAAVAIEPSTGRVRVLVSFTGDGQPSLGDRLYCKSIFPAASVFKVVTASAAMEKAGLTPESPLRLVGRNHTLYRFQLEEDLEVSRDVPLEEAFAYSMNPIFGRIGIFITGRATLLDYARSFGFQQQVPFVLATDTSSIMPVDSDYALAEVASGFNKVTTLSPVLGALIASSIVDDGKMNQPTLVDSVTDLLSRATIYRSRPSLWRKPIRPATALNMRAMMSEVARYGTARSGFSYMRRSFRFNELQFGGKTGSLDKDSLGKIDWFIGFVKHPTDPSQDLAVGVVTVHGDYWTVHSSYVAAEMMRRYVRSAQRREEETAADETTQGERTKG